MKKIALHKKAIAALEYIALIIFLLSAFLIFRDYIVRALFGQWQRAGDVFGHGRQYDPRIVGTDGDQGGTQECYCDKTHCKPTAWSPPPYSCADSNKFNTWIDKRCFDTYCDCMMPPESSGYLGGIAGSGTPYGCLVCIEYCRTTGYLCGEEWEKC